MHKHFKSLLCIAALTAAGAASAQKAGDNIVSVGLASINPDTNVGTLTNTGGLTSYLSGASAKVSSETTVSFGWLHMYTDNIGGEFTIGVPPTMTQDLSAPGVTALGLSANSPGAAKMDIWTPTVVGKYFFGTAQDKWRPYAGFGVSRVSFHNVQISSAPTPQALANASASFSSSWVPVYNAGVIYNIDDKWSINGSVSYLPITTTATFVSSAHGTTSGDVKLNTTDYVIRLGYRF